MCTGSPGGSLRKEKFTGGWSRGPRSGLAVVLVFLWHSCGAFTLPGGLGPGAVSAVDQISSRFVTGSHLRTTHSGVPVPLTNWVPWAIPLALSLSSLWPPDQIQPFLNTQASCQPPVTPDRGDFLQLCACAFRALCQRAVPVAWSHLHEWRSL